MRGGVVLVLLTAAGVDALMGLASMPAVCGVFVIDPVRPWPVLGLRLVFFASLVLGASVVGSLLSSAAAVGVALRQPWGVAVGWIVVAVHLGFLPLAILLGFGLSRLPLLPTEPS